MFSQQLAKFKIETKIKTSLRARGPPGVSGALCSLRILRIGRIGSGYTCLPLFDSCLFVTTSWNMDLYASRLVHSITCTFQNNFKMLQIELMQKIKSKFAK